MYKSSTQNGSQHGTTSKLATYHLVVKYTNNLNSYPQTIIDYPNFKCAGSYSTHGSHSTAPGRLLLCTLAVQLAGVSISIREISAVQAAPEQPVGCGRQSLLQGNSEIHDLKFRPEFR